MRIILGTALLAASTATFALARPVAACNACLCEVVRATEQATGFHSSAPVKGSAPTRWMLGTVLVSGTRDSARGRPGLGSPPAAWVRVDRRWVRRGDVWADSLVRVIAVPTNCPSPKWRVGDSYLFRVTVIGDTLRYGDVCWEEFPRDSADARSAVAILDRRSPR
jgi:hypothetical protein